MRNESELPRHDAWFELHGLGRIKKYNGPVYLEWLRTLPLVYMREEVCGHFPGGLAYPREEMLRQFGSFFFDSTVAWMFAKAISEQPRSIGLWGIEATAGEYAAQAPSLRHFVQVARDRGIEVVVPPGCRLLDPMPLYFDEPESIVEHA